LAKKERHLLGTQFHDCTANIIGSTGPWSREASFGGAMSGYPPPRWPRHLCCYPEADNFPPPPPPLDLGRRKILRWESWRRVWMLHMGTASSGSFPDPNCRGTSHGSVRLANNGVMSCGSSSGGPDCTQLPPSSGTDPLALRQRAASVLGRAPFDRGPAPPPLLGIRVRQYPTGLGNNKSFPPALV